MSFAEFARTIAKGSRPPEGGGEALAALWFDARGDWEIAHARAQEADGAAGAWVHAYLHRKEGNEDNADHWYARAGRRRPEMGETLAQEWEAIARALLGDPPAAA